MTYREWLELGLFASDYIPPRAENVEHPYELWQQRNQQFCYTSVEAQPQHREAGHSYYVWVSDVPLPASDFIGFPVGEFPILERERAEHAAKMLRIASLETMRDRIVQELYKLYHDDSVKIS